MIDAKHTTITLGDRRSRFTSDLDSSRTIHILVIDTKVFRDLRILEENKIQDELTGSTEKMGASSSTTIFHRVLLLTVKVEVACFNKDR